MTKSDEHIAGVYKPRKPRETAFYNCAENHFEELEAIWDELYASRYGFWRPCITDVIYRYLDCGDFQCGFARIRCDNCGHEYLMQFSCKRRHFCPSWHRKRVVEYGDRLLIRTYGDFLDPNPHLHAGVTDGCFLPDNSFVGVPGFHAEDLSPDSSYTFQTNTSNWFDIWGFTRTSREA